MTNAERARLKRLLDLINSILLEKQLRDLVAGRSPFA